MPEIKAKETYYDGYRFRSRLEARWAVFFDAAKIKYIYESEGYVIPCSYHEGTGDTDVYLPDFYLPDFDVYAEVKGSDKQLHDDAGKLGDAIDYMSTPMSEKGLILLGPIPYKEWCIPYFDLLYWHKGVCSTKCLFDWGSESGAFEHDIYYREKDMSKFWHIYNIDAKVECGAPLPDVSVEAKYQPGDNTLLNMTRPFKYLNKCYAAARQARFEYGERPITERI